MCTNIPDGIAKENGFLVRCSCERIQERKNDILLFISLDGGDDQLHKKYMQTSIHTMVALMPPKPNRVHSVQYDFLYHIKNHCRWHLIIHLQSESLRLVATKDCPRDGFILHPCQSPRG